MNAPIVDAALARDGDGYWLLGRDGGVFTLPGPASAAVTPGAAGGRVLVVSPTGSDANPGTASQPWRTFTKALRSLQPGDALYARGGGTYTERVEPALTPASAVKPILVAAYPGERPVIRGVLWDSVSRLLDVRRNQRHVGRGDRPIR